MWKKCRRDGLNIDEIHVCHLVVLYCVSKISKSILTIDCDLDNKMDLCHYQNIKLSVLKKLSTQTHMFRMLLDEGCGPLIVFY